MGQTDSFWVQVSYCATKCPGGHYSKSYYRDRDSQIQNSHDTFTNEFRPVMYYLEIRQRF